jgi:hypothetical protein
MQFNRLMLTAPRFPSGVAHRWRHRCNIKRAILSCNFPGAAPINHYRGWAESVASATLGGRLGSRTRELAQRTALVMKKAVPSGTMQ